MTSCRKFGCDAQESRGVELETSQDKRAKNTNTRTPRNGFASCGMPAYSSGLSPPISSVRIRRERPPAPVPPHGTSGLAHPLLERLVDPGTRIPCEIAPPPPRPSQPLVLRHTTSRYSRRFRCDARRRVTAGSLREVRVRSDARRAASAKPAYSTTCSEFGRTHTRPRSPSTLSIAPSSTRRIFSPNPTTEDPQTLCKDRAVPHRSTKRGANRLHPIRVEG